MSLTSLCRKPSPVKQRNLDVDEFIDNALLYARGFDPQRGVDNVHPLPEPNLARVVDSRPFRRATFTLSEECIAILAALAKDTGKPKSQIVRLLLHHAEGLPEQALKRILKTPG